MPSVRPGLVATFVLVTLAVASAAIGPHATHPAVAGVAAAPPSTHASPSAAVRPAEVDPAIPPATVPTSVPSPPVSAALITPATPPQQAGPAPPPGPVHAGPVYAIGDSVMIDIQPALIHDVAGVTVDGKVSRQFATGVQIIAALRAAGRLPAVVVVELGTNGTVTPGLFDAMMAAAEGATTVVFCTVHVPRSWESADNATIRAGVARYPNARLADWFGLSQGHPEWFHPDGYHLNPTGARALAALVAATL
ncbi:MAG TPA: hypothetical protein VI316_01140 [Candidatus Dormibacteraeota bacterium]